MAAQISLQTLVVSFVICVLWSRLVIWRNLAAHFLSTHTYTEHAHTHWVIDVELPEAVELPQAEPA